MIDNKKLALVHIVKKELGLEDGEYRDILEKAAGVRSAKYLDDEKFRKLMNYFARSSHYTVHPGGLSFRQKLFIKKLASDMGWSGEHLGNFLNKYYHVRDVNRLSKKEASNAIESLKNVAERELGRTAAAGTKDGG